MAPTTKAVATRQAGQPTIRDLLEQAKPKLAAVLPRHLNADRLIRVTAACIAKTPALQKCSPLSLLNCVMTAAQLGLEPTGVLGAAYLVPFGQEATLIIGYRGLIDLARRSGQIESIEAHVVHERDEFICEYGLDPRLVHRPCWDSDPGEMTHVYAVAKLKDGGKQLEVMSRAQVEKIREKSKAGRSGPWVDHFDEMCRKTVVRRLAKYLPLSVEMADALEQESEAERTPAGPNALAALTGMRPAALPEAEGPAQAEDEPQLVVAPDDTVAEFRRLSEALRHNRGQQIAMLTSCAQKPVPVTPAGDPAFDLIPLPVVIEAIGRLTCLTEESSGQGAQE